MRLFLLTLLPSFVGCSLSAEGEALEWRWSKEKAKLTHSIKRHLPDYELERVSRTEYYSPINIRRKNDRAIIYSYKDASENTVFTRWEDTLYIAEYWPISSGCEVVALDLKSGKQLWKTRVQGIEPVKHSKYINLINVETDGKIIIVTGNEASGRYVEHLDIQNGKTLANKRYDADPKSLLGD